MSEQEECEEAVVRKIRERRDAHRAKHGATMERDDLGFAEGFLLSEDPDWGELKLALNEAIWTKAPGTTTLEQAEHAACLAIGYLNQCFEANAGHLAPPP